MFETSKPERSGKLPPYYSRFIIIPSPVKCLQVVGLVVGLQFACPETQ